MTSLEKEIQKFEKRPPVYSKAEQKQRTSLYDNFAAINKFEGIVPSAVDQRLFQLLIAGKISKHEYLKLCLTDAHGKFQ